MVLVLLLLVLFGAATTLQAQRLGDEWLEAFRVRLEEDPAAAANAIREKLRWLFAMSPVLLTAVALLVIRQGLASVRSGFAPPPGSWIVAGQRTHAGRVARVRGHLQWLLGASLIGVTWVARGTSTGSSSNCSSR
jgi:hypothetical protein